MWQIDPRRLANAMARAQINQSQLAEGVGLKQPSIARLLSGETKTSRSLDAIASFLSTTPEFLKGETESPDLPAVAESASIDVPHLALRDLPMPFDIAQLRASAPLVPFPRAWLEPMASDGLDQLIALRAQGDAMMPTLLEGDLALVDLAQAQLVDQDRLFCLAFGDLVMLRRVRRQADGTLRLRADNPRIETIDCISGDCDLIGRVIWVGRQI